ncbi:tripartite tricarboxylate transporter substrate binding protein [Rhizobiaceae bacterium BDR2-2]|uniref:Tripartite tricarboxylate transporter substrate binding protein n=1 Tax=Ectorhizobium quercum TaxID=2965071 RepID=A0AAE3MW75_9HYPH|nr:tripartite tricarboxylate transporter substrate binding protein [Ectorhizobium quercum]MCX8995541.1 tripartite tricarboxylate transporter substrate binding protein [Ectorhizobium quercum]
MNPTPFPRFTRRAVLAAAAVMAAGLPAQAQDFPSRQIDYIIPYNAGGLSDNISRLLGEKLTALTGQQVINDYKPGAGGAIGANFFVRTPADGYTLLQSTNSFYGIIPFVTKVEYEPLKDLVPLVLVGDAPMIIAVNPSVPANTLPELIDYAKANPGALAFGTAGKGTVGHLSGEWLQKRAGIELLHIPYNGTPAALQAALSNEAQIVFGPESAEHIAAGTLKGIAVLGDQRWDKVPDLPATAEAGLEGWAPRSWHTVSVQGAVPDDIKQKLNELINGILEQPDVREKVAGFGLIPGIETLEGARQRAVDDREQFGELIRDAGLAVVR